MPPQVATRRRIDGIDLARGLAIIGMISVHVAPPLVGDSGWYALPYGRSSSLFALVAGIGIVLATRRDTYLEASARLLWRALWLAPLGVGLTALGTPVAVILQYYAVWFLLAIPVLRAPPWLLAALTSVGIVSGPGVLVWAQVVHPEWYVAGRGVWLGEFGDVLLTGYYPTVSWIWLVYAGMLLARLDLSSTRVAVWLTGIGTVLATVAYVAADVLRDAVDLGRWQPLLDTVGHADTPPEQLASLGTAVAVLGVCLLLGQHAATLVRPGVALGRFALTVYVGHLLVYAVARPLLYSQTAARGAMTTAAITLVGTGVAMAWLAVLPRGPLESLDRAGHRYLAIPLVRSIRGRRS
jgi:uncharacterized membrane protein YeiB